MFETTAKNVKGTGDCPFLKKPDRTLIECLKHLCKKILIIIKRSSLLVLFHEKVSSITDVEVGEDQSHLDEGDKERFDVVDLLDGLLDEAR